jgi:hypothetical protein
MTGAFPTVRVAAILLLGISLSACGDKMNAYRLDQINMLTATRRSPDQLEINYRPLSESLYFSPGISLSTHSDHIEVLFVRCPIKDKCPVSHAAEAGADGLLSVVIPLPTLPVRASDGKTSKTLYSTP